MSASAAADAAAAAAAPGLDHPLAAAAGGTGDDDRPAILARTGLHTLDMYDVNEEVGRGTFGTVFAATQIATGRKVAIKRIKREASSYSGIEVPALREVKLLQELCVKPHPNVVQLLDIVVHKGQINLVFEFCDNDLEHVISDSTLHLRAADIKAMLQMILRGVQFCHSRWVLHRDLKPGNLLLGADGELKLTDFGLGKLYGSPACHMTNDVVTRWYRAPELLFGAREYGTGVDIWAVGCIFAELLLRKPFLPGMSDIDQITKIFQVFGTPTEENWPSVSTLPNYMAFRPAEPEPLESLFDSRAATPDALDLLQRLLTLDPARRLSAEQALQHEYFRNAPQPSPASTLPRPTRAKVEPPAARRLPPGSAASCKLKLEF